MQRLIRDCHETPKAKRDHTKRAWQLFRSLVDRRIKFGAVIATGFPKLDEWARPVLKLCGKQADFVIHHSYKPGYYSNEGEQGNRNGFMNGQYGEGPMRFFEVIAEWRAEGSLRGLELR